MTGTDESWASSTAVRAKMRANRSRDTIPELAVRRLVHARGLRYRVDASPLDGFRRRADLVFTRARVAVFIDGCFWHGCEEHWTPSKSNMAYWDQKVAANRERDTDTDARLTSAGWEVLRFWEHQDPTSAADHIEQVVRRRGRKAQATERIRSDYGSFGSDDSTDGQVGHINTVDSQ